MASCDFTFDELVACGLEWELVISFKKNPRGCDFCRSETRVVEACYCNSDIVSQNTIIVPPDKAEFFYLCFECATFEFVKAAPSYNSDWESSLLFTEGICNTCCIDAHFEYNGDLFCPACAFMKLSCPSVKSAAKR